MNSTTYITLDLQAPNLAVVASAKQNDTRGRQIAATLRDGSASFDATGLLCEIRYVKPDGTHGFYDTLEDNTTPAYVIDGNVVTFTLAEQMLTVAGAVYVDVNFYATTGEKLTAFAFVLQVEASVLEDGTIVSSDYFNVLTSTLAEAAEIAANLPVPSTATPIPDSASGSAGTADGFSRGNHSHPLNVATSGTPANLGTAANGTSANYARQDHVHAMPSASDVGALTSDDVNYKIYDSVTDLGLTSGSATIAGAWGAMPINSILICPADEFVVGSGGVPYIYATVEIKKLSSTGVDPNRGSIHLWTKNTASGQNDLRMYITDENVPTGTWVSIGGAVNNASYTPTSFADNYSTFVSDGHTAVFSLAASLPAVSQGSSADIGTIGAGFRPSTTVALSVSGANGVSAAIEIYSSGGMRLYAPSNQAVPAQFYRGSCSYLIGN